MKTGEAKHSATAAKATPTPDTTPFFRRGAGSAFSPDSPSFFGIQPKLHIGEPGDKFEKEADSMADKVVQRMCEPVAAGGPAAPVGPSAAPVAAKPAPKVVAAAPAPVATASSIAPVQMKCAECEEKEKKQEEEEHSHEKEFVHRKCAACEGKDEVQRQSAGGSGQGEEKGLPGSGGGGGGKGANGGGPGGARGAEGLASQLHGFKGKGKKLPPKVKAQMEKHFGRDFGGVRIHTGHAAAGMNKQLHAHAFTHGNDIYFNDGKYDPGSKQGMHLLAHELTHTVQQGHAPAKPMVQRYSWDDFTSDVSDAADTVVDDVSDAVDAVGDAVDTAVDKVGDAVDAVGGAISDAASAAVDWLETEAGEALKRLADMLGVEVTISGGGLVVHVPKHCLGPFAAKFNLPAINESVMVPVIALPLGPVALTGSVGVTGGLKPEVQMQLGPLCLDGITLVINPVTNDYSISGDVSATAAGSLGALVTAGLRGSVDLVGIIPIGGIPIPIEIPLVGVEGGIAGFARGIIAGTLRAGGSLSYSGGTINLNQRMGVDLGLGADLFLGAYAQLDVKGEKLCRIYWQPYEWHGDLAGRVGLSAGISIGGGGLGVTIDPPTFDSIPFSEIPSVIKRTGITKDECPIIDEICEILKAFHLLPSQNGGVWDWKGTGRRGAYGPGPRLPGPMEVYLSDPHIASDAKCRGACGTNCQTCKYEPIHRYKDKKTGEEWEYKDFYDCNSNDGCRQHDAAYDWAADTKGETGTIAPILPWHMAANVECACNNLAGNCIAWIAGLPPFDRKMYFADDAHKVSGTTPPKPPPPPGPHGGGGGGGPTPKSSEEEELKKCDRHELPEDYCEKLQDKVIDRFGGKDRNLKFNPDKDADESKVRQDDAPILSSFRSIYNRLDSWFVFMRHRHPEFENELEKDFGAEKNDILSDVKKATDVYKEKFRDVRTQQTDPLKKDFLDKVMKPMQDRTDKLVRKIAEWYKQKTGNDEDTDKLIERIHKEATEMWRADWRSTILAVNRVLSVLWPPAKSRIEAFVEDVRKKNPAEDLAGDIQELDYIGSLARGYKAPSKQFVRFNPEKFDVDANLQADPLEKYAIHRGITPKKGKIFAVLQNTGITPLVDFCHDTRKELEGIHGYDKSDPFDVAIIAHDTPEQERHNRDTDRIYSGRGKLQPQEYDKMIAELTQNKLLDATGKLREDLKPAEVTVLDDILKRFGL